MPIENQREPEMGLTFEKVWASFQETERYLNERFAETDRLLKENAQSLRETERLLKESSRETDRQFRETDRQFKETDRKISKLGGRLGELVEHLVAPNLLEKFRQLGYQFGRVGTDVRYVDANNKTLAEVDILLENGDIVMAVEVKAKLTNSDVRAHIERMRKLRTYADNHEDKRKLIGAVAGAIIADEVKEFARKNGFYVLEQAGDTVKIDVPENFTPKIW
jgi:hypothetical protein